MHYLLYAVLFSAFAWMVLTVNGRRRVLALTSGRRHRSDVGGDSAASGGAGAWGNHPSDSSGAEGAQLVDSAGGEQHPRHAQREQHFLPNHRLAGAVDQPIHFARCSK